MADRCLLCFFQPDGSLSFVRDDRTESKQCGGRIEKSAATGRQGCGTASDQFQQGGEQPEIEGRTPGGEKQIFSLFSKLLKQKRISVESEKPRRDAPRFADGRFAAGQGKGRKSAQPFPNVFSE